MKAKGIFIIGLPGSHKIKVGNYIKMWLNWKIINLQEETERRLHKTMLEIVQDGEIKTFKEEEAKIIESINNSGTVIISSDILPSKDIIDKLKNAEILPIYLNYSTESLQKEIEKEQEFYPILKLENLEQFETEVSDILPHVIKIPVEGFSDREIALMIIRLLSSEYSIIYSNGTEIYEGINSFKHLDEILQIRNFKNIFFITYKRIFLINFRWIFNVIKDMDIEPYVFYLAEKEEIKDIEFIKKIWNELIKLKVDKSFAIISLGGGACSDVSGFCASTFKRGIPLVQIPTTLTSQIDIAIGNKNALHFEGFKNILGTTYYPNFILIDPVFLLNLEDKKFLNSISNVIKFGILFDNSILEFLEEEKEKIIDRYITTIQALVRKCLTIKAKIIDEDPYGFKKIINAFEFGNIFTYIFQEILNIPYIDALPMGMFLTLKFLREKGILKNSKVIEKVEHLFNIYKINYHPIKFDLDRVIPKIEVHGENIVFPALSDFQNFEFLTLNKKDILEIWQSL